LKFSHFIISSRAVIIMKNETLILGSSSPRRIEMMKNHGLDPIIIKPECDETLPDKIGMEDAVMYLSLKKALEIENLLKTGSYISQDTSKELLDKKPYIIAADTVVFYDGIIGKPIDMDDAFDILSMLSGKMHYVATGVSIVCAGTTVRRSFCEISKVFFKKYTQSELNEYLNTLDPQKKASAKDGTIHIPYEWEDKAGGYAIQGTFGKYIDHIEGDYDNIVGFPWTRIEKEFNYIKSK